ncbi:AraC family transcriptional regulator [Paenibacillus polymyxa]|uniref:AraC family transcriptional regulator n=1 Tax=Paenibacillus polymyxa TaxID=1406 RepID=UPI0020254D84|nr:AraC family transcriptional regulator [Paenibacillus polymyxa]MDU8674271.1 AraC family transcriptional regulator [Paenibacillus polymyxa]MDU8699179.1 AraC family transcriptional regulator [Paenibacillus polymyxa]URJ68359.1 AraC family transcriptional regulator [Paenibacillus polymyxa]WDZ61814.1 AraC family transcriptional regulator [Paenibacillus polymyxa]WEC94618.1 AraC family transcriptional regulator [Paenibacillus polymyxa]
MNQLITELAKQIARHTSTDGLHQTAISELCFRRTSAETEPTHTLNMPSLYVIAQGSKTVTFVGESFICDSSSYMVASVHLPVIGKITHASPQLPYLSLQLTLSPDVIIDISKKSSSQKKGDTGRGILVNPSTSFLLDAILRLVNLLDSPTDIEILAPLYIREIFYRVLEGEQGALLRQFVVIGSYAQGISNAIHVINRDYSEQLVIEELAKKVNMNPTTFHKHFKRVTGTSPLQYQKIIRLQSARRLMLTEGYDAATAGFQVGYESPSQFNREYARLFGRPPMRDISHLRDIELPSQLI